MALPDPVKISPLIKLARYAFLISGIVYGASRLNLFKSIAASQREEKERLKKEAEMQVAEEKRKSSDRDLTAIAALFNAETNSGNVPKEKDATPESDGTCSSDEIKKEPSGDQVNEDQNKLNEQCIDGILSGGNDYHVETFSKGVPYASPKSEKADFLPK